MSTPGKVHLYYHPTTVVVLDDDPVFLESFLFNHGVQLLCRTFHQQNLALTHICETTPTAPGINDYLVPRVDAAESEDWTPSDRTVTFKPSRIRHLLQNEHRFEEVSVAIIDYDMPGMTGLEVCRRLKDLPLKKIMLTGKADEKIATAAFNEKIIDLFVFKQDSRIAERIEAATELLQQEYFEKITFSLWPVLNLQTPAFLADPAFCRHFSDMLNRVRAVEYYLAGQPPGFLLIRGDGSVVLLLVQDEAALGYHQEMARDCGVAPEGLIEAMALRDRQPWFPTSHGYFDVSCIAWQQYLHPAERVGAGGWYCSLIEVKAHQVGLDQPILSCDAYRGRQEQTAP